MNFQDGRSISVAIQAQRDAAIAERTLIQAQMRALEQRLSSLRDLLEACDDAEASLEGGNLTLPFGTQKPNMADLVLSVLRHGPPGGMKMAEIVQVILRRYPLIHPKSPAVAATRIKRAGLATNAGGIWQITAAGSAALNSGNNELG